MNSISDAVDSSFNLIRGLTQVSEGPPSGLSEVWPTHTARGKEKGGGDKESTNSNRE